MLGRFWISIVGGNHHSSSLGVRIIGVSPCCKLTPGQNISFAILIVRTWIAAMRRGRSRDADGVRDFRTPTTCGSSGARNAHCNVAGKIHAYFAYGIAWTLLRVVSAATTTTRRSHTIASPLREPSPASELPVLPSSPTYRTPCWLPRRS